MLARARYRLWQFGRLVSARMTPELTEEVRGLLVLTSLVVLAGCMAPGVAFRPAARLVLERRVSSPYPLPWRPPTAS